METEIYYFSGTGNSLSIARDLTKITNGKLIPIASSINKESIDIKSESFGIVFPCYLAQKNGIPLIVENFVSKLTNISSKYIFAVCTCGGFENVNALPTLKRLNRLLKLKGGKLTAEFSIKLPMNNLDYPSKLINQDQERMFKLSKLKLENINKCIIGGRKNKYKTIKSIFNLLMTPLYLLIGNFYVIHLKKMSKEPKNTKLKYNELVHLSDNSITYDEKCNGCGICIKVCPVNNIQLVKKRPIWQHQCEMCLACDEWCPNKAIHHWCKFVGKDYHHPNITLSDILIQSQNK